MRRYTMLLLTAFLLFVLVVAGSAYLSDSGHLKEDAAMQTLTVYTTLPAEHADQIGKAYSKKRHVRLEFVPLSAEELVARAPKDDRAALVLADEETLMRLSAAGAFTPYVSEVSDAVPEEFKQSSGTWTGVWYDPVVFAVNRDYLRTLREVPDTWSALARASGVRIGMTDFMAADASAHLLYSLIAEFGDAEAYDILRGIHPNVVQYTKYLSNPVRQAGMGEADIAIAVESEALRYVSDGYPLRIIYPADGTAYTLTGAGILAQSSEADRQAAGRLLDWLLSDEAQAVLAAQGFHFLTTNPATLAAQSFAGKNLVLFQQLPQFTDQEKHAFLDRWVKYIRFGNS